MMNETDAGVVTGDRETRAKGTQRPFNARG